MGKFLLILTVLFIIVFIGQQSHFIETTKTTVENLGTQKEEYHLNWNNLFTYIGNIPNKIVEFPSTLKEKFSE